MQGTKFYPLLTDILPLENIPQKLGIISVTNALLKHPRCKRGRGGAVVR
jgi:hypothetical protein